MNSKATLSDTWTMHPKQIGALMNKILRCDDDHNFATKLSFEIRRILGNDGKKLQIYIFEHAEDIPKRHLAECDIAFLDIDFAGKEYTGIDIARQVRKFQSNAVIIFVTNFSEYAPEGYEVQAFRYLLKNEINKKLKPYLIQAFTQLTTVKKVFPITVSGDVINLPMDSILYMESQLHIVVAHMINQDSKISPTYSFYSTLGNIENQLSTEGFLRIHKSYLVNMKHIIKFQCKEAVLSDGTILKVSEKNYSEQKKKYLLWKGRQ